MSHLNKPTYPTEPDAVLHGRDASAQNARRHGLCSEKTLIMASECIEDYNIIKNTWFKAYKPQDDAENQLVQRLVDAEWFLQRASRTLAEAEEEIFNLGLSPLNWTDAHHSALARFTRYQTARANAAGKCRKAVEDYRKNRTGEKVKAEKHEVFKEKSKPEPTVAECIQQMMERKAERDRISAALHQTK